MRPDFFFCCSIACHHELRYDTELSYEELLEVHLTGGYFRLRPGQSLKGPANLKYIEGRTNELLERMSRQPGDYSQAVTLLVQLENDDARVRPYRERIANAIKEQTK